VRYYLHGLRYVVIKMVLNVVGHLKSEAQKEGKVGRRNEGAIM